MAELVPRHLTPPREAAVWSALEAQGGRAKPGRLAAALQTNIPALTEWLEELAERGLVRRVQTGLHVEWEWVNWVLDERLVCEAYIPRITALLVGRRELASRIAQELELPRVAVEETCRSMMLVGQLVGTPVQATYVYGLAVQGEARVNWEVVARVEGSPDAVFQRGLAQWLQHWSQPGLAGQPARAEPSVDSSIPLQAPHVSSLTCVPIERMQAQPPGPGLPEQAPSVTSRTVGGDGASDIH